MTHPETLIITRNEVARLLGIEECMDAVENAFALYAEGKAAPPKILGVHVPLGGFHIKAGVMDLKRPYFVAKTNANFPGNPKAHGLPTIQGVVAVRQLTKVFAYDVDYSLARKYAEELSKELDIVVTAVDDLAAAVRQSDICVTCTTSKKPFLNLDDIRPGTFIAAIGADSEDKQELHTSIVASSKFVVDLLEQSATIGELHHALNAGVVQRADVHGELGEIILGLKSGRTSDDEIIVFDSTGTALQDVVAAAIVYERAKASGVGIKVALGN